MKTRYAGLVKKEECTYFKLWLQRKRIDIDACFASFYHTFLKVVAVSSINK